MTKIKTKKKFGQHFLINENLALKISEKLILRKNIFEIGPGKGVLTKTLYHDENINLVVSEIDRDLVDYLITILDKKCSTNHILNYRNLLSKHKTNKKY